MAISLGMIAGKTSLGNELQYEMLHCNDIETLSCQ